MSTMLKRLKAALTDRSGTASIEFAITVPVVILMFLGGTTIFDIVRSYQKIVEANSVVADLVSRQTSIDKTYVDNLYGVFTNLQADPSALKALRISSIVRNGANYTLAWSKVNGELSLLPPQKLDVTTLPDVNSGDSIIYVEGSARFGVLFSILGLGDFTYQQNAFTRPRYISAVAYTGT